jgi:hypothetical protein
VQQTFEEELDRLTPVPEVFWGPRAPYVFDDQTFGALERWDSDAPEQMAISGDQGPLLPDRPYVFRTGVSTVYDARNRGDDAVREAVVEATGIDLDAVFQVRLNEGGRTLPTLTAKFGTDAFGTYAPWHAYGRSSTTPWGMYIFLENLIDWTVYVYPKTKDTTPIGVFTLLFCAVYRHELFHYHVERFATRLEILCRRPTYRPYVEDVRHKVAGTSRWLEEALAQAVVLNSALVSNRSGYTKKKVQKILKPLFQTFGPGYRDFECTEFGGVDMGHSVLAAQVARGHVEIPPSTEATAFATPLREYYSDSFEVPGYLVYRPHFVTRFQLATPKKHEFERFARNAGVLYEGPGPGDHQVWRFEGKRFHVNYVGGHLDLASLKALAKLRGTGVGETCRQIRTR